MKITGELLKTERISKNISIQEAAVALKLSPKMITAIESGDSSSLPAKTFVRGFVKSYAEYLKLDPDVVLRQFQEEMGTTSPLPKVPPPAPSLPSENIKAAKPSLRQTSKSHSQNDPVRNSPMQQKRMQEDSVNNKIALFISVAILLVAVIVISAKVLNSFKSDSTTVETAASDESNAAPIVPNYDIDPNAVASAPVPPVESSAPGGDPAAAGAVSVPVAAAPAPVQEVVEEEFPPSAGKPVEVIIEAKKDVEIFYAKGNTRQFKSLKIPPNQMQIIKAPTGLHLKTADGGAIRLIVNGIDRGVAGPNNKQAKLSF